MLKFFVFVCVVVCLDLATTRKLDIEDKNLVIYVTDPKDNLSTCSANEALTFASEFHNCFIDRKYGDGGRDLDNIVDRILEHAKVCVENFNASCRPNYKGFMVLMDKLISQMKDYCYMYLEYITHGRQKIKDLDCVETTLSNDTYQICFKDVFVNGPYSSDEKFQEKVEKGISCTNKAHKICSTAAKTSLNRMVRTILGIQQPDQEDIEEEVKPTSPPPMRWYDYIIQPFIRMWNSFRSFFGF